MYTIPQELLGMKFDLNFSMSAKRYFISMLEMCDW